MLTTPVRTTPVRTTVEAEVDASGTIRPSEPVDLVPGSRLLITILSVPEPSGTALLAEPALAADWNRPEEDAAWAYLGRVS